MTDKPPVLKPAIETKPATTATQPPAPNPEVNKPEEIPVPKEYASQNGNIRVIITGDHVSIHMLSRIAEDVGAYRGCKKIVTEFKVNQPQVSIRPVS